MADRKSPTSAEALVAGRESRFTHVHQVLPSLHVADVSGAHTLHVRDALRVAGYQSELFVDLVDVPLADQARSFGELDDFVVPGATAIVYQLAVGSWMVDRLLARKGTAARQLPQPDPCELLLEVGSRLARRGCGRTVAAARTRARVRATPSRCRSSTSAIFQVRVTFPRP